MNVHTSPAHKNKKMARGHFSVKFEKLPHYNVFKRKRKALIPLGFFQTARRNRFCRNPFPSALIVNKISRYFSDGLAGSIRKFHDKQSLKTNIVFQTASRPV
ncbi:hypothetical protein [Neisseria sp. CCUG12390]|uniref:hypothetical protein n=1 Tax=Neisseria sp. CCUG12390 TaxID=3392035 RepID=UPI003A0FF0A6